MGEVLRDVNYMPTSISYLHVAAPGLKETKLIAVQMLKCMQKHPIINSMHALATAAGRLIFATAVVTIGS